MTPTFETILSQAKTLTPAEKARLIEILVESENMSEEKSLAKKDQKVLAELKKIIDEQEKKSDSNLTESAKIAERLRQKNDRGYTL